MVKPQVHFAPRGHQPRAALYSTSRRNKDGEFILLPPNLTVQASRKVTHISCFRIKTRKYFLSHSQVESAPRGKPPKRRGGVARSSATINGSRHMTARRTKVFKGIAQEVYTAVKRIRQERYALARMLFNVIPEKRSVLHFVASSVEVFHRQLFRRRTQTRQSSRRCRAEKVENVQTHVSSAPCRRFRLIAFLVGTWSQ